MAETMTKEEFQNDMAWLIRRINEENEKISSSPAMSSTYNSALAARAELIQRYVEKQIEGQKQFGSYGVDSKGTPTVIRTVPKEMEGLLARLNNPKTKIQAAELATPLVLKVNTGTVGMADNPGFYKLDVTSAQLKQVDKIGDVTTPETQPTPKKEQKPGVGGEIKIGSTKTINGVVNTWNGKKWVPETSKKKRVTDWEPKFREMFPGQTWLLDIDRTKYSDVFKIFQDAVTNRAWESEAATMRFKTQLDNSSFMKELKSTNKVAQIKSLVGDLGFDTLPFTAFVTKAMNFGWDDATLKQEAYKEVFRKDDAGNYVNPQSVTRAKASNDYLRISSIGKAYFNNLSDDTIEKALVGGLTTEDVQRQQREVAKTKYSHLSNLIDQGVTLQELSSSFQKQAAQLLERDPNSIDMSTADFEQAFNFGEEGKKRMMTSGEWEIKLRSDPRFNWDKTQNAKQEAMSIATSIAQAFGKVI